MAVFTLNDYDLKCLKDGLMIHLQDNEKHYGLLYSNIDKETVDKHRTKDNMSDDKAIEYIRNLEDKSSHIFDGDKATAIYKLIDNNKIYTLNKEDLCRCIKWALDLNFEEFEGE